VDFSKLSQLGRPVTRQDAVAPGKRLTGIVKVKVDGYQPAKLNVRAELSGRMFTADFLADDLAEIQCDPQVEAISISETLPLQKLP
jgi:hypothetical protein